MICSSIIETMGNTNIIRINHLLPPFLAEKFLLYLKLESSNPSGSHKIRPALNIVNDYESKGLLKPFTGQTIVASTGGNFGKALAMISCLRGYRVILIIPDNYSQEKQKILKALGAKIILSDSNKGGNSHAELAVELMWKNPQYVMINQFVEPANPEIHYQTTAQEIIKDFEKENIAIDYFLSSIGSGGTISGIGEVLKSKHNTQIIGVQPLGCQILENQFVPHPIQGLAVGMIPPILNVKIIDRMISVTFQESLDMMKALIQKEGLLVGLSTGANIAAALKLIDELKQQPPIEKTNILTIAYDSANDYLDLL